MSVAGANLRDRLSKQYEQLLDNFANLLRAARLPDEAGEAGARSQGRVPGELMEVFAEKVLQACHALLAVVAELKRNALLNDAAGRNAEVASSAADAEAETAQLQERLQQLQQRLDAAMQLMPALPESGAQPDAAAAVAGGTAGGEQQQRGAASDVAMEHI